MAKYDPFTAFLERQPPEKNSIQMSFQRLEEIIGRSLPPSPTLRPDLVGQHHQPDPVQAHAWLDAVWHVALVDLGRELVTFIKGRP